MPNKLSRTEIEDKALELVENLNAETFIFNFLSLYNFPQSTITRERKKGGATVKIKNKIYYEAIEAFESTVAKVEKMTEEVVNAKPKPRYLIATDFDEFSAKDTKTGDTLNIKIKKLPQHASFFLAWNGTEKSDFSGENMADYKAADRFTRCYDELIRLNPDAEKKALNLFLIRLLFMLFSEDSGIMPKGVFTNIIKTRTAVDGSDLNATIKEIFEFLDLRDTKRANMPIWLKEFPYVNGKLFSTPHIDLIFDKKVRKMLLEMGEILNWRETNPDILGAMLQNLTNKDQRSKSGMHYTSVANIEKLIKPLFLEDLQQTYKTLVYKIEENKASNTTPDTKRRNLNNSIKQLKEFQHRLSQIKFLDPACGSGNFLIIIYKELRRLEIRVLKTLKENDKNERIYQLSLLNVSQISLNQFYGIEIEEFAHEVARLSLWIAEHQMNIEMTNDLVCPQPAMLPLRDEGNIFNLNALRIDWEEVFPVENEEAYIVGNPPYIGASVQNNSHKLDMEYLLSKDLQYKKLDYIVGWFYKGANFIERKNAKLAFVTTNSICQGEQVALLWKYLLQKTEIELAYTSFKWGNSAKNNAGVTVAIIGLANKRNIKKDRSLYDENLQLSIVNNINPYLASGANIIIQKTSKPIHNFTKIYLGNKPSDSGGLIIDSLAEKNKILTQSPELNKFIKKYVGGYDFINGLTRYCFWINEEQYNSIKENPIIQSRIKKVENFRLSSTAKATRESGKKPWAFFTVGEYNKAYDQYKRSKADSFWQILIPRVSSENRSYVPMGFVGEDVIIADSAQAIYNAPIWLLGLISSKLHMVWLRSIGGKLKTDYRYSAGLVYNTFPVPPLSTQRKNMIEEQILEILDLREEIGGTLAELYNNATMPDELREAHEKLDVIIERAYLDRPFKNDNQRLSYLLKMYQDLTKEVTSDE